MTDPHSHARPAEARVTHVALDLDVDFEARVLRGRASLDITRAPGTEHLILDTHDLALASITDGDGRRLAYSLGDPDPALPVMGRALAIELPDDATRVVIDYATSPAANALQWLAPEQTAGKTHPLLFSQGQSILTRSWVPTQDTPGVRQTYEARITVPDGMVALMAAEQRTPEGVPARPGRRRFEFRMPQPVPPHLVALAVGDLAFRAVGPRTGVFAEPALVDRARAEFADLEAMMAAGEAIGGPYRWDRFDVLVLPPSFPYGGMENPRLAFVTPALIAGDRSLTTVVAHELAHAWAGNLVVNATWSDFWLNEGFTVYLELRINEALFGPARAAMLEAHGHRELLAAIAQMGPDSPDTMLHIDLAGRDPDAGVTVIPYIKGAAFLRVLERAVGRARFDEYLRSWFDRHAFRSVTTAEFLADVRATLFGGDPAAAVDVGIAEWVYRSGLPANAIVPVSDALAAVEAHAAAFAAGGEARALPAAAWAPQEWRHFLASLPRDLPHDRLRALDDAFALSASTNAEILFAWLRLTTRARWEPSSDALERFVTTQGRGRFLRPLYAELMASDWGRPTARRLYARARPFYHFTVRTMLDRVVGG